jgi:hypothetical protein
MNALQKLKFVVCKRESKYGKATVPQRRAKLAARIDEQIALASAQIEGREYEVMQPKTTVNKETGERITKETAKRIKAWYWTDSAGKINFEVLYGAMKLELSTGKNAVQVANMKELVTTLQLIKAAATGGELDAAIDAALAARKRKTTAA